MHRYTRADRDAETQMRRDLMSSSQVNSLSLPPVDDQASLIDAVKEVSMMQADVMLRHGQLEGVVCC